MVKGALSVPEIRRKPSLTDGGAPARRAMQWRMAYVLHYAPDNASLIVRLALHAVDVPFETRLVDRRTQAQTRPPYLALNPNGLIPTLETPDGVMFETTAILLYLSERHGTLMPQAGPARAAALKWLVWLGNTLHPALRMMFYPQIYTDGDVEDVRRPARQRITRLLTLLAHAGDASWLEGPPIAPSFYLGAMLRWCALYGGPGWFDLGDHPRLSDFAARLESTMASARASTDEGLGPHPFTAPRLPTPPEGSAV